MSRSTRRLLVEKLLPLLMIAGLVFTFAGCTPSAPAPAQPTPPAQEPAEDLSGLY